MAERYEVIIAGAGPAGALLGCLLARAGREVVLLEKHRLPRAKPCGGGVTPKAAALLPFPWDEVGAASLYRSALGFRNRVAVSWPSPVCHMVRRAEFDHFLVRQAVRAGVRLVEGCALTGFEYADGGVLVRTPGGSLRGALLAGADGAHSRVAAILGARPSGAARAFAAVTEVPRTALERQVPADDLLTVDFAAVPAGYGWVFPKRDHLNVGVYTTAPDAVNLRRCLQSYLQKEGLEETAPLRAFPIPVGGPERCPAAVGPVLLLGDAAGFADPLTGEGIYWALLSATLAAEALSGRNRPPLAAAAEYRRLVDSRIRPELRRLARLSRLFYRNVTRVVPFLEKRPDLAREFWEAVYMGDYERLRFGRLLAALFRSRA